MGKYLKDINVKDYGLQFTNLTYGNNVQKIIIHHTGNANNEDTGARQIHQMHLNNDWAGIGYHFVIRKDGSIEKGRPVDCVGAHCPGQNSKSLGVHLSGNFEIGTPTDEQIESLALLGGGICNTYGLSPYNDIYGHRDFLATACPGAALYKKLDTIKGKAAFYMQNGW